MHFIFISADTASPGRPYGGNIDHFNTVEANMKQRFTFFYIFFIFFSEAQVYECFAR